VRYVIEIVVAVFSGCLFVLFGAAVIYLMRLAALGALSTLVGPVRTTDRSNPPDLPRHQAMRGNIQTEGWLLCVCRPVETRNGRVRYRGEPLSTSFSPPMATAIKASTACGFAFRHMARFAGPPDVRASPARPLRRSITADCTKSRACRGPRKSVAELSNRD